ncbi:MAG: hypothetical protein Q4B28_03510 [bacterium]|nr:hypothetical protein [bacterium]
MLNWKGSKIVGTLPENLNRLTQLEYFDVSENYLTDPLPTFDWTALSKLKTFNIRNNYIGGLNTRANPLTNKWQKFKPREQWQLIITQGGQRKTAINDLSPTDQVGVVIKQAQRRDAESWKDDIFNVPIALYPYFETEMIPN